MAGSHQIWVIDLLNDQAYPYAGTGEEARRDGAVNGAAFAQPSGIAVDGNTLYVADAECNAIRAVQLPPDNLLTTLAGGDLFEFGDRDGRGDAVRLQHPLGVAARDGRVFIADTYNHKIKLLDPATGRYRPLRPASTSQAALNRRQPSTSTDTNKHAIRTVDFRQERSPPRDRRFDAPDPGATFAADEGTTSRLRAAWRLVGVRASRPDPQPSWYRCSIEPSARDIFIKADGAGTAFMPSSISPSATAACKCVLDALGADLTRWNHRQGKVIPLR